MKALVIILAFGIQTIGQALSTDGFINLNFEYPDLSHAEHAGRDGDALVAPTSEVLMGWKLSGPAFTFISELAKGPISLLSGPFISRSTGIDFGQYSLIFANLSPVTPPDYHLSQIGTLPDNATSLLFYVIPDGHFPRMLVNGSLMNFSADKISGISYANVSEFAGRKVNLDFIFPLDGVTRFDIAGFVTTPEPSTYALFGIGAVLFWWQVRRKGNGQ